MGVEFDRENKLRQEWSTFTSSDATEFAEVCLAIKDPQNVSLEEASRFDAQYKYLREKGWPLSRALSYYWDLRSDFVRPKNPDGTLVTTEEVADEIMRDYEARKALQQAEIDSMKANTVPTSYNPVMDSDPIVRDFHRSIIQEAMLSGEIVLYRAQTDSIKQDMEEFGLPPHIPLADPLKPFYPAH